MGDDEGGGERVVDVGELKLGVSAGEEKGDGLTVRGREGGSTVKGGEGLGVGLPRSVCANGERKVSSGMNETRREEEGTDSE